jgi:hypothetical protein
MVQLGKICTIYSAKDAQKKGDKLRCLPTLNEEEVRKDGFYFGYAAGSSIV